MSNNDLIRRKEHDALCDRVTDVEAELMGDERTGRPSLRKELTDQMKTIRRIAISILVALIIGVAGSWLGISEKLGSKTAEAQSK